MSTGTNIEWTKNTFNPWWGCVKVHQGCTNCYAETLDNRYGGNHWGNNPRRMVLGEWSKPAKWNREAAAAGRIDPVFCASMCDLFEDYTGDVVDQQGNKLDWSVDGLRRRVFGLIAETPSLLWQLLTKRPENVLGMVPLTWLDNWPDNVITGTSPCDQKTADESIPHLLKIPGRRFLSIEPLLGPVDIAFTVDTCPKCGGDEICGARADPGSDPFDWYCCGPHCGDQMPLPSIDWVIVGCESDGKRAGRYAAGYEAAARDIIKQCQAAGVPVFHKQMPINGRKSGTMSEWPADLRVREMPANDVQTA